MISIKTNHYNLHLNTKVADTLHLFHGITQGTNTISIGLTKMVPDCQ